MIFHVCLVLVYIAIDKPMVLLDRFPLAISAAMTSLGGGGFCRWLCRLSSDLHVLQQGPMHGQLAAQAVVVVRNGDCLVIPTAGFHPFDHGESKGGESD